MFSNINISSEVERQALLGLYYARAKKWDKAVQCFEYASQHFHSNATCNLALCYERGMGFLPDLHQAISLYEIAADRGNPIAQYYLAMHRMEMEDISDAMRLYTLATRKLYALERCERNLWYQKRQGDDLDVGRMVSLLQAAAKNSILVAHIELGFIHQYSVGNTQKNLPLAVELFSLAAERNETEGMFALANCYVRGEGVRVDYSKALSYLKASADAGNPRAQHLLASWYESGIVVETNFKAAASYYKEAALQEHLEAMYSYALYLEHGIGTEKNESQAVGLYRQAAKQGYAPAQYRLGRCCEEGIGKNKNPAAAVKMYQLASIQDYPPACFRLGLCLEKGVGTQKNSTLAFDMYARAAVLGDGSAQHSLGRLYEFGIGCQKNTKDAFIMYQKSVKRNHPAGFYDCGRCFECGIGVPASRNMAMQMYRRAAQKNIPPALYRIGRWYEFTKNQSYRAMKMYRRAAEKGHVQSLCDFYYGIQSELGRRDVCDNEMYAKFLSEETRQENTVRAYRMALERGHSLFRLYGLFGQKPGSQIQRTEDMRTDLSPAQSGAGYYVLGLCLEYGIAGRRKPKSAFLMYRKASNQKFALGFYHLARCYASGYGCEKNELMAETLYKKAASLGICRTKGKGMQLGIEHHSALNKRNIVQVILGSSRKDWKVCEGAATTPSFLEWGNGKDFSIRYGGRHGWIDESFDRMRSRGISLEEACRNEDPDAMVIVALDMQKGKNGCQKNERAAFHLLQKAAERNFPPAEYYCGCCFEEGCGCEKNEDEAFRMFSRAASHGFWSAVSAFGCCLELGRGCKRDENAAFHLYSRFSGQGDVGSFYNLGNCYEWGRGCEKSISLAIDAYFKAAEQKDGMACFELGRIFENGLAEEIDFAKASHWYKKSADYGYHQGMFAYGRCCELGIGCKRNEALAFSMYQRADQEGNTSAKRAMDQLMRKMQQRGNLGRA